jgi:hypothetical protein
MTYVVPIIMLAVLWWQSVKVAYARGRRDQMRWVLSREQLSQEIAIGHTAARKDAASAAWR